MKLVSKLLITLLLLLTGIECFAYTLKSCTDDGNHTISGISSVQYIYGNNIHGGHLTTFIKRVGSQYVYCIDDTSNSLSSGDTLHTNGSVVDAGYEYLLNNGFPTVLVLPGYGEGENYTATQLAFKIYGYLINNSNVEFDSSGKSRFLNVFIDRAGNQIYNFTGGGGNNTQTKIADVAYNLAKNALAAHDNAGSKITQITLSPSSLTFGYSSGKITTGVITATLPTGTVDVRIAVQTGTVELYDENDLIISDGNFTSRIKNGKVKFKVVLPNNQDQASIKLTINATTEGGYCQYTTPGKQATVYTEPHLGELYQKNITGSYESSGVVISKQDIANSKELPGATICIKDSSNNKVTATGLDSDGCFVSGNVTKTFKLNDGSYKLCETIAPTGYTLSTTCIAFDVVDGKAKQNGSEVAQVVMTNEGKFDVEISKQDATTGTELPGAHLVVKDMSGNVIEEWDSTSTPHIIKLSRGKYTLEETIAPEGYKKKTTKVTINVPTQTKVVMKNELKTVPVPPTSMSTKKIVFVLSAFLFCTGSIVVFMGYHKKFN